MGERIAPPCGEKKEEPSTHTLRTFLDTVFCESGFDEFRNQGVVLDFFETGLAALIDAPGLDAVLWTGSLARHCIKPQHIDVNWDIKHAFRKFLASAPQEPALLSQAALDLSHADQDLDVVVQKKSGHSLYDVYTTLVDMIAPPDVCKNPSDHLIAFPCPSGEPYTYVIQHRAVPTNPSFQMITLQLQDRSGTCLAHIDVSQMPETTEEALSQRRHGGMTVLTQDLKIPLTLVDSAVSFHIPEDGDQFLNLPERIETEGKSLDALVELAMRSLRMRLIHTPEQFDPFVFAELPSHMHVNALFALRAALFSHGNHNNDYILSDTAMELFVKECMICAYRDPFTTMRFLKDTGLYLVIPGMRDMTQEEWRKCYSSSKMKVVINEERLFQDMRDPRSLRDVDTQRQAFIAHRRKHNGFIHMLLAYGDAMESDKIDIPSIFTSLFSSAQERNVTALRLEKGDAFLNHIDIPSDQRPAVQAIVRCMTLFPAGLTEKEIQTYVEKELHTKYTNDIFRTVLRAIKKTGAVMRHGRSFPPKDFFAFAKRQISFYTLRYMSDHIHVKESHTVLNKDVMKQIASLCPTANCEEVLSFLEHADLHTKEAIQALSRNDFSDLYTLYKGSLSRELFFQTLRNIRGVLFGGPERTRTSDLSNVNRTL